MRFRKVDPASMENKPAAAKRPRGRQMSPEMEQMIAKIRTITDETIVYEVTPDEGKNLLSTRQQLLRAARHAGVEIAVRKTPDGGSFYVGLMTDKRRSNRGRKRVAPEAAAA